MAMIEDKQVIAFANSTIRPMSDRLYSLYYFAKSTIEDWNSKGLLALVNAAGPTLVVDDGALIDGRTQITGNDMINIITALTAYVAFVEGGAVATLARTDVIAKPHVNTI